LSKGHSLDCCRIRKAYLNIKRVSPAFSRARKRRERSEIAHEPNGEYT
jgi:hypothetical protein